MRRGSEPSLTIFDEKKSNSSEGPPKKDKLSNGIVSCTVNLHVKLMSNAMRKSVLDGGGSYKAI